MGLLLFMYFNYFRKDDLIVVRACVLGDDYKEGCVNNVGKVGEIEFKNNGCA